MEIGSERPVPTLARSLFDLSHFQLEAAAGALCRSYGYGGATQSALLGIELALKAGLAANGATEDQLKDDYGHNFAKMTTDLAKLEVGLDRDRVLRALKDLPAYVPSRYASDQPTRIESGHIMMKSQYVVSEVVRQIGNRDIRKDSAIPRQRRYPS